MREHPVIFSTEMIPELLDGVKTQTRRVIKPQPTYQSNYILNWKGKGYWIESPRYDVTLASVCPYGQVGDRLWVRETWATDLVDNNVKPSNINPIMPIWYKADIPEANLKWRPSIFMPRWASRITLEITEVRAERLQEITSKDAEAEGIKIGQGTWQAMEKDPDTGRLRLIGGQYPYTARYHYEAIWDSLNAKRGYGWETNCWVWVIGFKVIK